MQIISILMNIYVELIGFLVFSSVLLLNSIGVVSRLLLIVLWRRLFL